ncbi:MAG: phosphatidylserine decarboxylase [Chlamydiales bacterium]|nr:phosphatidylserine decarboxylase [Chlamydiales bacterium]
MPEIHYIDRLTKREEREEVYGRFYIETLYGNGWISKLLSLLFLIPTVYCSCFSRLYGSFQKSRLSRYKIRPFIEKYKVDEKEFLEPTDSFSSFNDFFIRKLKPSARPMAPGDEVAVLPADARYLVYPNIALADGFLVKNKKFSLEKLLQSETLAQKYAQGSLVIARLCPLDYHRFHFPCDGVPEETSEIKGPLFSVNPTALKKNIEILAENKRAITPFHTKNFGTILYIEVGATYVGTIHQTFAANDPCQKGDEKGFFSFGGSSLILLFEPSCIQFDQDLLDASQRKVEVRAHYGQSLGHSLKK